MTYNNTEREYIGVLNATLSMCFRADLVKTHSVYNDDSMNNFGVQ